jgi:hypothetical protein
MISTTNTTPHTCSICLEETFPGDNNPAVRVVHSGEDRIHSSTNHVFHRDCIQEWQNKGNNTCPACRGEIVDLNPNLAPPSDTIDPNISSPFWTHRKVLSTILLAAAATLTLTAGAFRAQPITATKTPSLQETALKFAISSITNHPQKCGAAIAALSIGPEILKILKFCLWDSPILRVIIGSSTITAGIITTINLKTFNN